MDDHGFMGKEYIVIGMRLFGRSYKQNHESLLLEVDNIILLCKYMVSNVVLELCF